MERLVKWNTSKIVLALSASVLINACGGGGSDTPASGNPPPGGSTPAPTITFSATPSTLSSGGDTTLNWTSTNATSCTASNGWSGTKQTASAETITNVQATTSYTITCTGAGGSNSGTVTVTVATNTPSPVITFSASPTTVSPGGATTLTWSATNADSCGASGDWSGAKQSSNTEVINNISVSSTYTLTCTGAGGSDSSSVSILLANNSDTVSGKVDSSYIDRESANTIYVYSGTVTPDDYDGDGGDPDMAVPVTQIENSCSWNYSISSLPAGNYTLAFTSEAEIDNPATDDPIVFSSVDYITKGSSTLTHHIDAASILRVGPTRTYKTPSQAHAAANNGDVIEIDAGTYTDDVLIWRRNNLTIRGVGGRPHIQSTKTIPYTPGNDQENGMGIWVTRGSNIKVENVELSGAKVPDLNGAGIRADNADLYVCNVYFHDNENGILGGSGNLHVEYSEFNHNGNCIDTSGCGHNMYINEATDKFTLRHSYSHHANQGHNVKTRAKQNYILYNRIMDESTGNSSYAVDISNGGLTYLIGNLIQQGPNTENSTIVAYGAEGLRSGRTHRFYMVNNTVVNDRNAGTFVSVRNGTDFAKLANNIFVGNGSMLSGTADTTTNLVTSSPAFENIVGYDYRLTSASTAAIDAGTAQGIADGFELSPKYVYLHNSQRQSRSNDGSIDIGAYEY